MVALSSAGMNIIILHMFEYLLILFIYIYLLTLQRKQKSNLAAGKPRTKTKAKTQEHKRFKIIDKESREKLNRSTGNQTKQQVIRAAT